MYDHLSHCAFSMRMNAELAGFAVLLLFNFM